MDAVNQLKSLFATQARTISGMRSDGRNSGFSEMITGSTPRDEVRLAYKDTIDRLPVEPEPVDDPISPLPEGEDDTVDPRGLLTQKLFMTLIGGFPALPTPERPEVPIIDRPMA